MLVHIQHGSHGNGKGLKIITVKESRVYELVPGCSCTVEIEDKELVGIQVIDLDEMDHENPLRRIKINCDEFYDKFMIDVVPDIAKKKEKK